VARFQPEEIFRRLGEHEVHYVVIGGVAATLHGSPLRTGDADICPERGLDNLQRLAAALRAMDARIRAEDAPEGLAFGCDARFLAGIELLNLTTRYGDLDISFRPAGTEGFPDLVRGVVHYDLEGLVVPVADLADVIRSKEAANREKDRMALPVLRELLRRTKG
jgi:hypothetical protein